MQRRRRLVICNLIAPILPIVLALTAFGGGPRAIEITATRDNKFKVAGQKDPVITLKPREVV